VTRRDKLVKHLNAVLPKNCQAIIHVREYNADKSRVLGYSVEINGLHSAKEVKKLALRLRTCLAA